MPLIVVSENAGAIDLDIHPAALRDWVPKFVVLNNRLAGIVRAPTVAEVSAHRGLLAVNTLRVANLELFVHHIASGATLRRGLDAEVASHWDLRADLSTILEAASSHSASPDRLRQLFRMLSPFTDGNGRCGRVIWMWQLMRRPEDLAELARLDLLDVHHPLNADAVAAQRRSEMAGQPSPFKETAQRQNSAKFL